MSVSNVSFPPSPASDTQLPSPTPIQEFAGALEFFSNAVGNFAWYGIAQGLKETNDPTMVRMSWSGFKAQYPEAAKVLEKVWNPK